MTDEWMRHPVTGLTAPHHATQTDAQAQEAPVDVQDTQKAREERWAEAIDSGLRRTRSRWDEPTRLQASTRAVMALADEEVLAAITVARQDMAQCVAERDQARAEVERLAGWVTFWCDKVRAVEELASRCSSGYLTSHAVCAALAAEPTPPAEGWQDTSPAVEQWAPIREGLDDEPTPPAAPHAEDGAP